MRSLALVAGLLVALALAWFASVPPTLLDRAYSPFSVEDALKDVEAIASRPHPAGSAEHARARDLLLAKMRGLGLETRIQAARGFKQGKSDASGADVTNLIGILPGRDRRAPVLALMAHYDSVPGSPGAADDAAGVAVALDMVRAFAREKITPARDFAIILTDAEENGLLGARAFFAADPLARRIGTLINMDTRGSAGRVIMYETGLHSGALVRLYGEVTGSPTADSVAAFVRRLIRNNSDFAVAADHGVPGLNFAFLGSQFDYHAASSTPANLDPGTLRHLGDQVWGVTRALATRTADPPPQQDPVYASLLALKLIVYPAWAGWLVIAVALLIAAVAWPRDRPTRIGRGAAQALYLLLAGALALHLARLATGVPFGFTVVRPLLARWGLFEAACACLALAVLAAVALAVRTGARRAAALLPLAAGLLAGALALAVDVSPLTGPILGFVTGALGWAAFAHPVDRTAGAYGALAAVLVLALVAQLFAPSAAVIPSWALLAGALVLLLRHPLAQTPLATLLLAQLLATAHLILLTVGENLPEVVALYLFLAAPALLSLLAPRLSACLAAAASLAAVAILLILRLTDPYSPARPRASQVLYLADADGRFRRISSLAFPDRWTLDTLAADGGTPRRIALPPVYDSALVADAKPATITRPRISAGNGRVIIAPPPGAREVRIAVRTDRPLARLVLNGFPTTLLREKAGTATLAWFAPRAPIVLDLAGEGRAELRVGTLRDGWPADARPRAPRPADAMLWYNDGATLTVDRREIALP